MYFKYWKKNIDRHTAASSIKQFFFFILTFVRKLDIPECPHNKHGVFYCIVYLVTLLLFVQQCWSLDFPGETRASCTEPLQSRLCHCLSSCRCPSGCVVLLVLPCVPFLLFNHLQLLPSGTILADVQIRCSFACRLWCNLFIYIKLISRYKILSQNTLCNHIITCYCYISKQHSVLIFQGSLKS